MTLTILVVDVPLPWLIIGTTLVLFFTYDYWCHTYWKRQGIPYVSAWPVLSNMVELSKGVAPFLLKYQQKFGTTYGMYHFRTPGLVCGDPDMLKNILVRNFDHFKNRRKFLLDNKELDSAIANLRGERWHDIRHLMSSAFSSAKVNKMSFLVNTNADVMLDKIDHKMADHGYIDCKDTFGSYVMDVIGSCAFGLDIDSQGKPTHPFIMNAKVAVSVANMDPNPDFSFVPSVPLLISGMIPGVTRILKALHVSMFSKGAIHFFQRITLKAIEFRRKINLTFPNSDRKTKSIDVLGLMMDTQHLNEDESNGKRHEDQDDDHHHDYVRHHRNSYHHVQYEPPNKQQKLHLSDEELVAQTAVLFLAGYDSTRTLLTLTSYLLARHPVVQDKLIKEIDEMLPAGQPVDHKSVSKLQYLDQVFCESLRMYPPTARTSRECNKTFVYKDITIPKGMQVIVPIIAVHHNPDLWPEPDKFIPERFSKEEQEKRHPFTWLPWGGGPRICLAPRFTMMIAKTAMARILQKYRFETCSLTDEVPQLGVTSFIVPRKEIILRAVPRHHVTP